MSVATRKYYFTKIKIIAFIMLLIQSNTI